MTWRRFPTVTTTQADVLSAACWCYRTWIFRMNTLTPGIFGVQVEPDDISPISLRFPSFSSLVVPPPFIFPLPLSFLSSSNVWLYSSTCVSIDTLSLFLFPASQCTRHTPISIISTLFFLTCSFLLVFLSLCLLPVFCYISVSIVSLRPLTHPSLSFFPFVVLLPQLSASHPSFL